MNRRRALLSILFSAPLLRATQDDLSSPEGTDPGGTATFISPNPVSVTIDFANVESVVVRWSNRKVTIPMVEIFDALEEKIFPEQGPWLGSGDIVMRDQICYGNLAEEDPSCATTGPSKP